MSDITDPTGRPPPYPPPPPPDLVSLGRSAFERYSELRRGAAVDGRPIPGWDDVDPGVRNAWGWAVGAALNDAAALAGRPPPYPPPPPPELKEMSA